MKQKIIILMAAFVMLTYACKKDLDLSSNEYYGIKAFINSKNAQAKCGHKASCEGKTIKLKGLLDENNINKEVSEFWLIDEDDADYTILIKVDTLIKTKVFDKIETKGGTLIKIKGIAEGYDKQMNFSCDRVMLLNLSDIKDVMP